VEALLDVHVRGVKIKKYIDLSKCSNDASSTKKTFMKKYMSWVYIWKLYLPCDTIIKIIIRSTSSIGNRWPISTNNSL
jgi:hypothetical protein